MNIPLDIQNAGPHVVAHYQKCLKNGCAPMLAEMLALRAGPKLKTNDVYHAGLGTLDKQFEGDEKTLDLYTKTAMKHGYKPKPTDHYCHALAEFGGDPKAFVPHDAEGHIRAVCRERGWDTTDGSFVKEKNHSGPEKDPPSFADLV